MTAPLNLGEQFVAVAKARRSIRAFTDQPVPMALLERIFETAMQAPSNCNTQPWFVHVATGSTLDDLRAELPQRFVAGDIGQRAGGALASACASPTIKLVSGTGRGRACTATARCNRGDGAGRATTSACCC